MGHHCRLRSGLELPGNAYSIWFQHEALRTLNAHKGSPRTLSNLILATTRDGSFFFLIYLFYLFLFLAVLGFRCCARAFSSCSKQGLCFVAVRGLLIAGASLIAERGL